MAYHHGDLASAAKAVARDLVDAHGFHAFTLADVAKAVGTSRPAIYRHFADKETLLALLAIEAFEQFRSKLSRSTGDTPLHRLKNMVRAYIGFADRHAPRYELMFSAGLDQCRHPELAEAGDRAFGVLSSALADLESGQPPEAINSLAFQVWALCHGMASLRSGGAMELSLRQVTDLAMAGTARLVDVA